VFIHPILEGGSSQPPSPDTTSPIPPTPLMMLTFVSLSMIVVKLSNSRRLENEELDIFDDEEFGETEFIRQRWSIA
jgi:hypothetical protein